MLESCSPILKISIDTQMILGKVKCHMMAPVKMGHTSHFIHGGLVQSSFSSSYQVTNPNSPKVFLKRTHSSTQCLLMFNGSTHQLINTVTLHPPVGGTSLAGIKALVKAGTLVGETSSWTHSPKIAQGDQVDISCGTSPCGVFFLFPFLKGKSSLPRSWEVGLVAVMFLVTVLFERSFSNGFSV